MGREGKGWKGVSKEEIHCVSWEGLCRWLEKEPEALTQTVQYIAAIQLFGAKGKASCANGCCNLVRLLLGEFQAQIDQRLATDCLSAGFCLINPDVGEAKFSGRSPTAQQRPWKRLAVSASSASGTTGGLSGASPTTNRMQTMLICRSLRL